MFYCFFFLFFIILIFDLDNCHNRYCGSDEFHCRCRHQPYHLHSMKYCIKRSWICDGVPDCENGSDEIDCFCSEDEFQSSECGLGGDFQNIQDEQIFYCISKAKEFDAQGGSRNEKDKR